MSEMRKETHRWKTKWRHVFVNHKPKSSTVVGCHEQELCGLVHGDDFILTGDSVQLMWIESRLKEGWNFERCADLGVDDGVDKTVTILSQLVTWSNQTGILLARMSMDGFDICVVLCCGCEVRTGTSRNSIARTNQEFERYANVEILEFIHVYIVNCQTEGGPMRVMNSHRLTIFQGVKIEVAVVLDGAERGEHGACSGAWFDALWMRDRLEVPTMVESDACLERRERCVLIPSAKC